MKSLSESELILNEDGSIYHLCLKPGDLAETIITVGDPQRVTAVSKHFDSIELKRLNREFVVHTGLYKNQRVSVLSTGMGTDNIDIVWNELDALFNIDFKTRTIKNDPKVIRWIRLGTSGSIQKEIPVGQLVYTKKAIGLEGLMSFYQCPPNDENLAWQEGIGKIAPHLEVSVFNCSKELENIVSDSFRPGITATFGGFYAPQGRMLRARAKYPDIMDQIAKLQVNNQKITNMEMETSGIYGLANLLNHQAISLNAIIANRANGEFSSNANDIVEEMIQKALDAIIKS